MSTKVQCDMCRLSYSTEKELLDHSLSLMHHTKLEDKEKNPQHECPLCSVVCTNMADYRRHISTEAHQNNLSDFKGDKDRKTDWHDIRKSVQTAENTSPSSSWLDNANINNSKNQYVTDIGSRRNRAQDQNSGKYQLDKNRQSSPHLRYDRINDDMTSQMWDSDSWKSRYNHRNDIYHWSREGYLNQEYSRDISRKDDFKIPLGQKNSNSGTKYSSGYFELKNSGRYAGMSNWKKDQEGININLPAYGSGLDDTSNMDFTTDIIPTDWDENSFLEHEQFLHGVDTTYNVDRLHSSPTSIRTDVGKWEESNVRDRKRPRNEDDIQELLVKSCRSSDSSLDEHFPVRDVPRRQSGVLSTPSSLEVKPADNSLTDFSIQTKVSSIDNASNNILERAERLCKELRQKREASEAQKNLQLTKQNHEPFNEKSPLTQKQHMHYKANIVNSKKLSSEESYNSSTKRLQENGKVAVPSSRTLSTDSDAAEIQVRASDSTFSNASKPVEKSVMENQRTVRNTNYLVSHKSKQRSLSGGDMDLAKTKKGQDGLTDIGGRPPLNPMSKLLQNKDNLKKMVNTPNARDERLQLVKMFHSRMEQKTATTGAPRSHLQLEGVYDSVFASHDVNLDLGQTFDSQTIKLENLSESVRQQILDLIGSDVSDQSIKHLGTTLKPSNGLLKKTPVAQKDVIILSDDEDLRNVRKNKKNSARKMPGSSTSSVLGFPAKTSKKQKIITRPSNVSLKTSVSSSNSKSSSTNHVLDSPPTSPVQRSNKINKDVSLHSAKKFPIIPCLELGKGKGIFQKENISHNSSSILLNSKQTSCLVDNRDSKNVEDLNSKSHSQLDSCSIREKFPILLKISKADRASPVKSNGILARSELASVHSSHYNIADRSSEVSLACLSPEADIKAVSPKAVSPKAVSPKADVKPTLIQLDNETPSTEESTEKTTSKEQECHKLTLLPNSWLINRESSLRHYESQQRPFTNRSEVSSNENPESKSKYITSMDCHLLNGMDQSSAHNAGMSAGEGRTVTSDITVGTSSQTMSTLLMLSEKEEYVKQEKMSMDLRLSRLHKLLEQAVVQITKCTERMNKLHEEEQDLLKKRLSVLRVATSIQPSRRYVLTENNTPLETKSQDKSENGGADCHMTYLASDSGTTTFGIPQPLTNSASPALTLAENVHGTSLSKADWLAKFSSFLPQDSVSASSKITTAESLSLGNTSTLRDQPYLSYSSLPSDGALMKLNVSKSQSERDILCETVDVEVNSNKTHDAHSLKLELSDHLSQVSSSAAAVKQKDGIESHTVERSTVTSTNPLPVAAGGEPVIHSLISAPIMYVGSFRSTDHSMRLISPFVLERSDTRPLRVLAENSNFDSDRSQMVTNNCQRRDDSDIPTRDSVFDDLMHLPNPSRPQNMGKNNEFGGEESDIGSVASSMASGSSLGEQIIRYCRSTPGASLESRDQYGAHELSVIMSDTSEQRGLDSSAEEENDKSDAWLGEKSDVKPCSVSLERLDRKGICGSLDEKAVMSAEALHQIERHYEDAVGQSDILDNTKRRKRKTKQERDTAGFTRRRSHWITVSSSEDEGSGSLKQMCNSDVTNDVFRAKKSGLSSSVEKNGHSVLKTVANNMSDYDDVVVVERQSPSKMMNGSDVTIGNMTFLSPSKSASYLDVTVAECDSSTSMGAVNSESNFQVSAQKEMKKNFDPLSELSPKSSSPDTFQGINSSIADGTIGRNGSLLGRPEHLSSLSYTHVSNSNQQSAKTTLSSGLPVHSTLIQTRKYENIHSKISSVDWKTSPEACEEVQSASVSKHSCRFPGQYGPVFDIQVVKGHMYVGHNNRGVRVYNLNGLNQSKIVKEYSFTHLQCMTYKEHDDAVTLILGDGSDLVFCNSKEQSQQSYNLGTTIKCLLLLSHLVYAGLDTGEICTYDTLRMVLKDRYICSDHPIHCLASGKEGAAKLLCVSSQDGTIIVVDSQQFLPIRILRGHSKTAFSIQIEGHLVFSGSGDHTVLIQNLHTAAVEHVYSDSKGLVKSVCYSKGYLFTGGMDKLVRCYDVKTHKLVQVYYGADRGVVSKILVLDNMLITGNISGSVDVVDIDIEARHRCYIAGCMLTFGNQSHFRWHVLEDHNI